MKIKLISIANKMPTWLDAGFYDYAKRLPHTCQLELIEIRSKTRTKHADIKRIMQQEAKIMLEKVAPQDYCIALEARGHVYSTEQLAKNLASWQQQGQNMALLIGGPEGLHTDCLARAQQSWSLSQLTFAHPLVRLIVAEQLYRAWSINQGHPYHNGS